MEKIKIRLGNISDLKELESLKKVRKNISNYLMK